MKLHNVIVLGIANAVDLTGVHWRMDTRTHKHTHTHTLTHSLSLSLTLWQIVSKLLSQ